MRVLFICGQGKIENAIPTLKQRLKGAVELDTLGSLREIDGYFSRGHSFDKCVVLSPDRLIPDYTPELLEGEMSRFKKVVSAKSIRSDIILCVTNEDDGLRLVDIFSDMLGEVTIIQVSPQLKMTDLQDLIIQQGSSLVKKFPSFDLTTIAKNTAKELLDNHNKENYVDLSQLVKENKEQEVTEEIITPIGDDTDDYDNFNPNGFIDEFSGDSDNIFDNPGDSYTPNTSVFDFTFNQKDEKDFFNPSSNDDSDFFNPDTNTNLDFGNHKEINDDDSFNPAFNIENDNNTTENDDFDMFNPDAVNTDNGNNEEFGFNFNYEDEPIKQVEEVKPEKKVDKTPVSKSETVKDSNGSLDFIGGGKKASSMFNSNTKSEPKKSEGKKSDSKEKTEKKSFFGFGGNKKNATPKNNNIQVEDEYQLNASVNNPVYNQNMNNMDDEIDINYDEPEITQKEVSGKRNIGLTNIKNNKSSKSEKPVKKESNFVKPAKKEQTVTQEQVEEVYDNSDLFIDNDSSNYNNSSIAMSPGGLVDATDLFTPEKTSTREAEKGQGRGLETTNIGSATAKVGKKTNAELEELLKPYLKHGGLFVVTGSQNTGKTVVSANLANLLCRYGYRVCVLDLDFQGKGQSYLNLDTFRTVHGGYQLKMNSVNVVNSTGTDFAKWTDVVKSGYHVITTTLNSDVDETHKLVRNSNMTRLVRQLTNAYNFVIVDVGFHDLVTYFKDFADAANIILSVEEASQKGLTTFMLNMTNIEDEDITNVMFSRLSLVLNKEDGMKSLFGRKVNKTTDIMETLDDTVAALTQQMLDYTFTDIPVVSILKYSNVYEKFWYSNKYITDTKDGDRIFTEMLQNALNNI